MKDLLKTMFVLAALFASTFIIIKSTGLITLDDINRWLEEAQNIHPAYLSLVVIGLLFLDLFIAIPTMTVAILAGYFLGWPLGAAAAITGFFLAGTTGYGLSRRYGWALLHRIYKERDRLDEMHSVFTTYGPFMLIICRAMPILPEVSCCIAGATRMRFALFIAMYALGTVPYALVVTYAGSISSAEQPTPAIAAAIVLSSGLWLTWYLLIKRVHRARGNIS